MKQHQHIAWLNQQLPDWIQQQLITDQQAEALKQHYQLQKQHGNSTLMTFLGVLGAVLIGVGIILLFAYNWSDFSRPLRVVLSFSLLIGAQALVGYTLWKKKDALAWREGSASFLSLMLAATIALIGQTYHIPGDWDTFLLTCSLLALPLVYLLQVSLPAILYWVGVLCWYGTVYISNTQNNVTTPDLMFWGLFLLPIPWLVLCLRSDRKYQLGTLALAQTSVIVFLIAAGMSLADSWVDWRLLYGSLFAVLAMGWHFVFETDGQPHSWRYLPAHNLGKTGLLALGVGLSFGAIWERADDSWLRLTQADWSGVDTLSKAGLVLVMTVAWLALTLVSWRQKDYPALFWAAAPLMIALGLSLAPTQIGLAIVVVNLWLLGVGVYKLVVGTQQQSPSDLSNGLLLITLLILIRFMDSDLSILLRGLAFIGVGALFLVANIMLMKRLKEPTHEA